MIRFTSSKAFNKSRHQLPLCKDVNGKILYPYDFVRIWMPIELKTVWCARIWWNALDGAFVMSHPAHNRLHGKESSRDLAQIYHSCSVDYAPENRGVITKITYIEYLQWESEQAERDKQRELTNTP